MNNIIIISEEDRDILQRVNVEYESRMNIIVYILQKNIPVDKDRFDSYQKEYDEKYFEFENCKKNLERKYLQGLSYKSWHLNYNTCELIYE